jgi:hypothetical protein
MKNIWKLSLLLILFIGFISCSSDDNSNINEGTARMSVKLTDAPGDYDAVYIDVRDVVIKYNGSDDEVSIGQINAGVYDLLELTGGVSVLLVDDEIPAGSISQIRLILGDENSIVVNGETLPLSTPSAQQSGLKIQVNRTLEAGIFYEFILDFDVEKSIVSQGNGGYSLKPVIRASTEAETGAITGIALPAGLQTLIIAENGLVEISTYTNSAGTFVLSGVPEGTYSLTIETELITGFPPVFIQDVVVVNGEVTNIGTIDLSL